jgi:hypothetical protein
MPNDLEYSNFSISSENVWKKYSSFSNKQASKTDRIAGCKEKKNFKCEE